MIQLEGVFKSFRQGTARVSVLENLSVHIQKGEMITVRGVSGSGKSTLLHILAALDTPDQGRVVVNGSELQSLEENARTRYRREEMGIIFQFYNLIPTLTARENVQMALEILKSSSAPEDAASRILERVGLSDKRDSFPQQLSGGQQQRVAIARALVKRPRILLADEPTGNLDERTGEQIMDLIASVSLEYGMTVVVVTHDPSVAERGERRFLLKNGRLILVDKEHIESPCLPAARN